MYKIPSFKSSYHQDSLDTVENIIKRAMHWADGPEIKTVEHEIQKYLNIQHALTFNSGTSALYTLLLAVDVKGYEVICPTFTFIATVNAILLAGGIPVFADSEINTFGLDVNDVEKKISKNTKAIITIDYAGCIGKDTAKIYELAKKNGIFFIEDAAQSFGAKENDNPVGTQSDAAIFSFCQNKIITALGEGGAIVTNHSDIYEKSQYLRSHGRIDKQNHFYSSDDNDYLFPGFNFRMSTISAAFLSSQLKHIDSFLKKRNHVAHQYHKALSKYHCITLPYAPDGFTHCYQMYTIKLLNRELREGLKQHLLENKILVRCYFELIHIKPYFFKKYGNLEFPVASELANTVLTLPMYPTMTDDEINYVNNHIRQFLDHFLI